MVASERPKIVVVDRAHLRAEYFSLALVMSLAPDGIDRESLRDVLKGARGNLDDAQYSALQRDIRVFILGGAEP